MYELALFAGAGGGILGGQLCGHTCIGAVEIEEYPRKVLLTRQDDGVFPKFPIWDDIQTFRSDNPKCTDYFNFLRSIREELVISGGFPCQDISIAGKGAGITGQRSGMWFEMQRVIEEVRPRTVFIENSPQLRTKGLGEVLYGLTQMGYDCRWGVLGAWHVSSPHKRDRMWVLGNTNDDGYVTPENRPSTQERSNKGSTWEIKTRESEGSSPPNSTGKVERISKVSYTDSQRCQEQFFTAQSVEERRLTWGSSPQFGGTWWASEPQLGRVADGVADRSHRLKAIGNGQVPAVVKLAWDVLNYDSN